MVENMNYGELKLRAGKLGYTLEIKRIDKDKYLLSDGESFFKYFSNLKDVRTELNQIELVRTTEEYHKSCYGVYCYKWGWAKIKHPGVWGLGGQEKEPKLSKIVMKAPSSNEEEQWLFYMGPIPNVSK